MYRNRFVIVVGNDAESVKKVKGMEFKKYNSAVAIAQRLSDIHQDRQYWIYDYQEKVTYKIERV